MAIRRLIVLPFAFLVVSPALSAHDGAPELLDRQPMYVGPGWRNAQRRNPDGTLNDSQPAIQFPAYQVTLLSWLTLTDLGVPDGGNANACTGYTSPSGREYAIIGLSNGTAFVEVTQPGDPAIVAVLSGSSSFWRDVETYGSYAYVVSEGGGGIRVVDLSSIDSGIVTTVALVNDDSNSATHTLSVDAASGFLYRCGGNANSTGLRVYSLANPAAPARVGTWSTKYVHDAQVVTYTSGPAAGRQIAYCCTGLNNGWALTGIDVLDVTDKSAIASYGLGNYQWATSAFSHQVCLSPDGSRLYLDDEWDEHESGAPTLTEVFDATDPAALVHLTPFTNGNTATGHNLFTKDDRIYESNYRSGLRVFQTSSPGTPDAPVEIAYFDTFLENDSNELNGQWQNYPYFQSGTIIGSDVEKGLFVWWVGDPTITFTLLDGERQTISPNGQTLRVRIDESSPGVLVPGTAKVHLDTGSGFVTSDLVASGDLYGVAVPPTPCGTPISYYFTAQSTNGVLWSDPPGAPTVTHTSTSGMGTFPRATDDFETDLGWVASAVGATGGFWERGTPASGGYGPGNDADGNAKCYVTGIAANSDVNGGSVVLTSPDFDMTGGAEIRYSYYLQLEIETIAESLVVDINGNGGVGTWTRIATHDFGTDFGWRAHVIGHGALAALGVPLTANTRIRFTATDAAGPSIVEAGVDAVEIRGFVCTGVQPFCYGDGSGAPCPCGNIGGPGAGCDNSLFTGGAVLVSTGTASVSSDTLVLISSEERPTAFSLFLQGNQEIAPVNFGDGLRCAGGALKRLYSRNAVNGTVTAPQGADPSITARSAALGDTLAGDATRIYHVYYRDPVASFCPSPQGSTFNASNGLRVLWAP